MENSFRVNMNEYLPLRDVVFNTLRQAILKGELAPGERLMEIQLAEKLGVSRTPIREAIRKLELEGLVLMIPRKGAEVAKISEKSLRDVLEVRRSLEELAIELACQRMSPEDLAKLEQMYRYRLEYIKDEDKRQILLIEHDHIVAALRDHNIAEAKKAAREHIDNQEITVSRNIKEQEEAAMSRIRK